MDTREQKNAKFILYMIDLVVSVVESVIFAFTDLSPLAGAVMLISSMKENLEALTVDRCEYSGKMQLMNWIVFGVSVVSLTLMALSALGYLKMYIPAALSVVVPAKYVFNAIYFYNND